MNLANKLTLIRIMMIPVFIVFVLTDLPYGNLYAAIVFLLASATDAIDGYIARKRKEVTNLGMLLDPLADKLLVTAALVTLVSTGQISSWIAIVIIGREFLVTGLRGIAAAENIVIAASNSAKLKTIVQISAVSLLLIDEYIVAYLGFSPGQWMLYLAVAFTLYTGYDYVVKTFSRIKMT